MLQYPVMLVHGMGFRDDRINYWGRIPDMLRNKGIDVFYGEQDSNGSIEDNGVFLKKRIENILEETGADKINIIAHSKGGLDARYAISSLGAGENVASLTTLCTPHNGSKTIDMLLKVPKGLVKSVSKCVDVFMKMIGDEHPNTYKVVKSFSTKEAKKFNERNPADDSIYYQSYSFVMDDAFSDVFIGLQNFVVNIIEGENDGFLTPEAVKYGDFKGVFRSNSHRGISHFDGVDMRRHRLNNKSGEGVSDILEVYDEIISTLEKKNF